MTMYQVLTMALDALAAEEARLREEHAERLAACDDGPERELIQEALGCLLAELNDRRRRLVMARRQVPHAGAGRAAA
jgi:hypothetical protein